MVDGNGNSSNSNSNYYLSVDTGIDNSYNLELNSKSISSGGCTTTNLGHGSYCYQCNQYYYGVGHICYFNYYPTNSTPRCPWCNGIYHKVEVCSRIQSIEYFKDGSLKKVEFKTPK